MKDQRNCEQELRGVVVSLALGGLLAWKPQLLFSVILLLVEPTQKVLAPAVTSMMH